MATDILDHRLRRALNDEVHARPPERIETPSDIAYLANLFAEDADADGEISRLARLLEALGTEKPPPGTKHINTQFDNVRLRWERHTEFSRYAFIAPIEQGARPFAVSPLANIPGPWLDSLRGDLLVAVHLCVVELPPEGLDVDALRRQYFDENIPVGAMIAGDNAAGLTDFRIHSDGFSRYLVLNAAMSPEQTGRYVQRLLELETYRMMALLALPVAQKLWPELDASDRELAAINRLLVDTETHDESVLLKRMTELAAANQSRHVTSEFRFAAAEAYYDLVLQRTEELREKRIPGIQTFGEFTARRLNPAIKTCRAVSNRLNSLVERLARATQLLSTRVDVDRQMQNQLILASVNRRLKIQLRLQATVEGLSVAAVTYYVVGLIGFVVDGLTGRGVGLDTTVVMAFSVPLVAGMTWYAVRRVRRGIDEEAQE